MKTKQIYACVKKTVKKAAARCRKRFESLDKAAYIAMRAGLAVVGIGSVALLSYVCRTESLLELMRLEESVPALTASVVIVILGGLAIDSVIRERK